MEGHELEALQGALDTIKRCQPVIAIEYNENVCKNFLLDIDYHFVKAIPGLKIWVHNKDSSILKVLKTF